MANQASNEAIKVLQGLRESATDGYNLLSRTRLTPDALEKALRELLDNRIIIVKGQLESGKIGEVYVSVRPSARGYADMMVQLKEM